MKATQQQIERAAQLAALYNYNKTALRRLYTRVYDRMTAGGGYQPFGYDWVTIRVTLPGFYDAMMVIGLAHDGIND